MTIVQIITSEVVNKMSRLSKYFIILMRLEEERAFTRKDLNVGTVYLKWFEPVRHNEQLQCVNE